MLKAFLMFNINTHSSSVLNASSASCVTFSVSAPISAALSFTSLPSLPHSNAPNARWDPSLFFFMAIGRVPS